MDRSRKILDAIDKLDEEVDSSRYYGDGSDKGVQKARVGLVKELIAGGCVDKKSGVEFVQSDLISLSTRPTASGKRHRPRHMRRNVGTVDANAEVIRELHAAGRSFVLVDPWKLEIIKAMKKSGVVEMKYDRLLRPMARLKRNPASRNLAVHSTIRYEVDADSVQKATKSFVELKKKRCLTRRDVDVLAGLLQWSAGVMHGAGVADSIKRRSAELHIAIKNYMAATGCAERNKPMSEQALRRKHQVKHHFESWGYVTSGTPSADTRFFHLPLGSTKFVATTKIGNQNYMGGGATRSAAIAALKKQIPTRNTKMSSKIKPKRIPGGVAIISHIPGWPVGTWPVSVDDLGGNVWLVAYRARNSRSPIEYRLVRVIRNHDSKISRVQEIGPGFDLRADAVAHAERHDMVRNAPKKKGKKMAKKTKKKTKKKGGRRPATPGGQRSLGIPMGLGAASYYRAAAAKKKAKKKSTKKKAKKKSTKRAAPKRKAPKKKAKKLTAAQKLARKRSTAVRKAKRTRMAVKASACRVGRQGRVAQGKKPGRCPPKPKLRKGKVGAPMAGRMHRSQGHKVSQKTSELIRNFYNLKNELD